MKSISFLSYLQAGIGREQLKLALEPEAASIFIQNIPSNMITEKLPVLKSGTKYAIADLGGKNFKMALESCL